MKYSQQEEEKILKEYKLTQEEHDELYEIIKRTITASAYPTSSPIAVIVGAQTGAGKTGILAYSQKMFKNNNVVIINSDEIKPFHPKSEEIAKKYPELYTKITDQESNTWTSRLFEEARKEGYNLIFEGTMKNNRIADESITDLKKLGYTVVVRGLAVCDLESRLSIYERYIAQVKNKGWGRLVVPEHHNQTYIGMPKTIKYIEDNNYFDVIEIFRRGENPDTPQIIYSNYNKNSQDLIDKNIKGRGFISQSVEKYGYKSADDAVIRGREEDYSRVLPTCKERFKTIKKEYIDNRDYEKYEEEDLKMENQQLKDLMDYYSEIVKKKENNAIGNVEGYSTDDEQR